MYHVGGLRSDCLQAQSEEHHRQHWLQLQLLRPCPLQRAERDSVRGKLKRKTFVNKDQGRQIIDQRRRPLSSNYVQPYLVTILVKSNYLPL